MRILVATSSLHGSTHDVGRRVASIIERPGLTAHWADAAEVAKDPQIDADAVVLGSAIYMTRPMAAARDLAAELDVRFGTSLPVCVFGVGLKNITADPFREICTRPRVDGDRWRAGFPIFGGVVVPDSLSLAERAVIGLVGASGKDSRDPEMVEAWAEVVADELSSHAAV